MSVRIGSSVVSGSVKGIVSSGAPSQQTVGIIGQLYFDTATGYSYICSSISGNIYTWSPVSSGGGGSTPYDGVTLDLNSSDELQVIGQIDQNSGNPTFDWVGTYSEYVSGREANPQTITDDMLCYITDDYDTPNGVVSDVLVDGTSVVTDGIAEINVPVDDVQINGTSILSSRVANIPVASTSDFGTIKWGSSKGIKVDTNGVIGLVAPTDGQVTAKANNDLALTLGKIDLAVRNVQPAYTAIEASTASTNLAINSTYGQTPSVPVAYVIPAPTAGVDNWIKMFIDTSSVASISFTTTGGVSISPNQISDIEIGHKYMVVINYDNLHASWALFIKDMGTV